MSLFNYECDEVKYKIDEVSPNYPQLTTYEKEWLYFHKYGYIPGIPVELEYETVNVNPIGMVSNAIPYRYKSAILKGNTDENLQSVKMPVLTTTGKNLFDSELEVGGLNSIDGENDDNQKDRIRTKDYIKVKPNTYYIISRTNYKSTWTVRYYDVNYNHILPNIHNDDYTMGFKTKTNVHYIRVVDMTNDLNNLYQLEEGSTATPYEPYKSNILTVNEDVTLRSNGDVYDELNLLTGRLTQRIDENNEVLAQAVVKTVDLTTLNKPYEGTNHYHLTANIPCEAVLEVPVVSTGKQTLKEIND